MITAALPPLVSFPALWQLLFSSVIACPSGSLFPRVALITSLCCQFTTVTQTITLLPRSFKGCLEPLHFNVPHRPGPQCHMSGFMEAIISVYSLALTGSTSILCLSLCSEATLTSCFNVMGNVMTLSLCSIVNSVTTL